MQGIEELQRKGRHEKVYEIVKNSTKKPTQRGGMSVQDKDGVLLHVQDPEQVKKRWKEFVEDLYQAKTDPRAWTRIRWMRGEKKQDRSCLKKRY